MYFFKANFRVSIARKNIQYTNSTIEASFCDENFYYASKFGLNLNEYVLNVIFFAVLMTYYVMTKAQTIDERKNDKKEVMQLILKLHSIKHLEGTSV